MNKNVDVVLIQCEMESAPTTVDYKKALEFFEDGETLEPVQYGENNTFAGGFMTEKAAESIEYFVREDDEFGTAIREILGDASKETEDGVYEIMGLTVLIKYTGAVSA